MFHVKHLIIGRNKSMKNKIIDVLNEHIDCLQKNEIEKLIEIPPKPELGDF